MIGGIAQTAIMDSSMMIRTQPLTFSSRWASSRPRTMVIATATATNWTVIHSEDQNWADDRTSA